MAKKKWHKKRVEKKKMPIGSARASTTGFLRSTERNARGGATRFWSRGGRVGGRGSGQLVRVSLRTRVVVGSCASACARARVVPADAETDILWKVTAASRSRRRHVDDRPRARCGATRAREGSKLAGTHRRTRPPLSSASDAASSSIRRLMARLAVVRAPSARQRALFTPRGSEMAAATSDRGSWSVSTEDTRRERRSR